MVIAAKRHATAEEYLAQERLSETKNEYFAGEIFAMAGASRAHNLITANVTTLLNTQLENADCEVYSSDLRVKVSETGLYTYPDVVVMCGEPHFEDADRDTLLNPIVIVEVLSKSTEGYDRGDKFAHYRTMESLQEYVLISQHTPRLERYARQPNGEWILSEASKREESLRLECIGCLLEVSRVYRKVTLMKEEKAGT